MGFIVPNGVQSVAGERALLELFLAGCTQSKGPAPDSERLMQALYPGYELVNHETLIEEDAKNTLHLYLEPIGDPVCPSCQKTSAKLKDQKVRLVNDVGMPGTERTVLHLPVRRVRCACGCRKTETISWLDSRSRFTRRLAACAQSDLRNGSTISGVSRKYGLDWKAVKELDLEQLQLLFTDPDISSLRRMAIDEFSLHKGHRYATAFMDLDTGKIFYVVEGKSNSALEEVFEWLKKKGVAAQIECVAVDMNAGFPGMVKKHLPNAQIVYDLFHVMKNFNEQLLQGARKLLFARRRKELTEEAARSGTDKTKDGKKALARRIEEAKKSLRGVEWLMVQSKDALQESKQQRLEKLIEDNALLAALYPIAEQLRDVWKAPSQQDAVTLIAELMELLQAIAVKFSFKPAKQFADMLKRRYSGIVNACRHKIGTNRLEGANNKIKTLRRSAFGYRDFKYFALKIKGILPGTGKTPWNLLDGFKAVINGLICDPGLRSSLRPV